MLAGGGPEEDALRARLGGAATFLGWLEGDALARAYADADLFLFCSQTDTFGQVVLEAQASGLPVVAVDAGGPAELIASGRTGVLCPPRAERARRRRRRPRRLARRPRAARPRRRSPPCASAPGKRRWPRSAPAGSRAMAAQAPTASRRRAPARRMSGVAAAGRRRALRLVARGRCGSSTSRSFYGERSGGIRTYLDAKVAYARRTGAFEHHLVVPGVARDVSAARVHELPSLRVAHRQRLPLAARHAARWSTSLRELEPDVVLLHDPFWAPARGARSIGVPVVMVHHGSLDLDAAALPGPPRALPAGARRLAAARLRAAPTRSCRRATRTPTPAATRRCRCASAWTRRSIRDGDEQRGDHVLYAGRLSREKGVFALLEAAARSRRAVAAVADGRRRAQAARSPRASAGSGSTGRVRMLPHERDREALAARLPRARAAS